MRSTFTTMDEADVESALCFGELQFSKDDFPEQLNIKYNAPLFVEEKLNEYYTSVKNLGPYVEFFNSIENESITSEKYYIGIKKLLSNLSNDPDDNSKRELVNILQKSKFLMEKKYC